MTSFAEIQGSANQLNGLLPALRNVDYDLRPGKVSNQQIW